MYLLGMVQNNETSQNNIDTHTQRPAMMYWFLLAFEKNISTIYWQPQFSSRMLPHEKGTLKEIQSPLMKANENLLYKCFFLILLIWHSLIVFPKAMAKKHHQIGIIPKSLKNANVVIRGELQEFFERLGFY